jgi:hypothetical protein
MALVYRDHEGRSASVKSPFFDVWSSQPTSSSDAVKLDGVSTSGRVEEWIRKPPPSNNSTRR